MSYIETYRYQIIVALITLTVVSFVGLRGKAPTAPGTEHEGVSATTTDEAMARRRCGFCVSQAGANVDCHKATQTYTCTGKTDPCASVCR